jgi:hypothetical protein
MMGDVCFVVLCLCAVETFLFIVASAVNIHCGRLLVEVNRLLMLPDWPHRRAEIDALMKRIHRLNDIDQQLLCVASFGIFRPINRRPDHE